MLYLVRMIKKWENIKCPKTGEVGGYKIFVFFIRFDRKDKKVEG